MKKTLATLLAAACCAFSSSGLASAAVGNEITVDDLAGGVTSATIAITLNVDAVAAVSGSGFGGINDVTTIFTFNGDWDDADSTSGAIGLCTNGSSTTHVTGFYGVYSGLVSQSNPNSSSVDVGMDSLFNSSTDWDSITSIAVAVSLHNNGSDVSRLTIGVAIAYADGTVTKYQDATNEIDSLLTFGSLTVNSSMVDSYALYEGYFDSNADASAFAEQHLVPEPATATLSLLALAGLAARRRRK